MLCSAGAVSTNRGWEQGISHATQLRLREKVVFSGKSTSAFFLKTMHTWASVVFSLFFNTPRFCCKIFYVEKKLERMFPRIEKTAMKNPTGSKTKIEQQHT